MDNWSIAKPLVRLVRAMLAALGCLRLYSLFQQSPGPIITGEKQTKKSCNIPALENRYTEFVQSKITYLDILGSQHCFQPIHLSLYADVSADFGPVSSYWSRINCLFWNRNSTRLMRKNLFASSMARAGAIQTCTDHPFCQRSSPV